MASFLTSMVVAHKAPINFDSLWHSQDGCAMAPAGTPDPQVIIFTILFYRTDHCSTTKLD